MRYRTIKKYNSRASYRGEGAPKFLPRWKKIRFLVFGWTRLSEIPRDTLYIYVSTSCKNSSKRPQVALHCLRRVASLQRIALYVASEGNKRQPPRSLRVNSSSSSFPDSTLSCIYDLQSVTKVYTHPLNTIYYGKNVGCTNFLSLSWIRGLCLNLETTRSLIFFPLHTSCNCFLPK